MVGEVGIDVILIFRINNGMHYMDNEGTNEYKKDLCIVGDGSIQRKNVETVEEHLVAIGSPYTVCHTEDDCFLITRR